MVDIRRVGGAIGHILVRGIEVSLAVLLIFSVWALGELPTGSSAPEQTGTFVWAFLFSWGFATVLLVVVTGIHLIILGYRRRSAEDPSPLRRPLRRVASEIVLGAAIVVAAPPLDLSTRSMLFMIPAVLAWTVLIHFTVDLVQFGRSTFGASHDSGDLNH